MAIKIKDNPEGCVDPTRRGERTCSECYWSQVKDKYGWTGNESCWNAQCLVPDMQKGGRP